MAQGQCLVCKFVGKFESQPFIVVTDQGCRSSVGDDLAVGITTIANGFHKLGNIAANIRILVLENNKEEIVLIDTFR